MAQRQIGGRYNLRRRLLKGDAAAGVPELWLADDAGDVYYAKLWKRVGDDRADIKALWNREVRALTRLQGYPGAVELFVRLYDLHAGEDSYYAILDGGRRELLSQILSNRGKYPWLTNLSEVSRRRPLWEGILRLAEGMSVLHKEGTLHRSLSSDAVFSGPDGQGDLRLSGFEWSLRIASRDGASPKVLHRYPVRAPELEGRNAEYSTSTDWFDFGVLTAEIFGAPVRQLRRREGVRNAVQNLSTLREGERAFIFDLVAEDDRNRLADSEYVIQGIRQIIRELSTVTAGAGRRLLLAVRLSSELEISRTIEVASEGKAPGTDPMLQCKWIENDLSGDVRVVARNMPQPHFVVRGRRLEYRVMQWSVAGLTTWDVGFCQRVERAPRSLPGDQYYSLGQRRLEIQTYSNVRRTIQTARDRSAPWTQIFPFTRSRHQMDKSIQLVYDFFRITQHLDTLFTIAQICPVEVLEVFRSSRDTQIEVTPLDEGERNDLAHHLYLDTPAAQLRDWFGLGADPFVAEDEEEPDKDIYTLLDRRTIDSDGNSAEWKFVEARRDPRGPRYRFRCDIPAIPARTGRGYLARNHNGTLAQIRRRHKAIDDLRFHEGLLRLLVDPRAVSRSSNDDLPPATSDIPLDYSKLEALAKLWRLQPSFAIQGPPGTGKTTLINAFADRLFPSDPSAQVLVTAHSHHTVDDVRSKLSDLFSSADTPILVRLGSPKPTEHDIDPVTNNILGRLYSSALSLEAPPYLHERLRRVSASDHPRSGEADEEFRSMLLLVQDAANLTFSTSNAGELAELAARGRRFDWSIIEEAGKAHGFDMAIAFQESHRLLLIGDHRQLSPFNASVFKKLLLEPLRIKLAIQAGAKFAPGYIDPSLVEDDDDELDTEPLTERCARWRQMVTLFEVIFESSLGTTSDSPGPAATLTDQHRMHPDIADLVGMIFYPNDAGGTILRSPPETHDKFQRPAPFRIRDLSWLPEQRIIWCDVAWQQKEEFSEGEIDGLFAAPKEAEIVVKVLEQLVPVEGLSCHLQILSPYRDQLIEIKEQIDAARHGGRLDNMFEPPFDLRIGKRLGATVDEFQGSEADVVVASLVRNNALVPWKSVGFLKEPNRMNVLLSRAKHKLIIVGSWDFFVSRCNEHTPPDAEYVYIRRMMEQMSRAQALGRLARMRI